MNYLFSVKHHDRITVQLADEIVCKRRIYGNTDDSGHISLLGIKYLGKSDTSPSGTEVRQVRPARKTVVGHGFLVPVFLPDGIGYESEIPVINSVHRTLIYIYTYAGNILIITANIFRQNVKASVINKDIAITTDTCDSYLLALRFKIQSFGKFYRVVHSGLDLFLFFFKLAVFILGLNICKRPSLRVEHIYTHENKRQEASYRIDKKHSLSHPQIFKYAEYLSDHIPVLPPS